MAMDEREIPDFQPTGAAWNPLRPDIEDLLDESEHRHVRPIYYGSNHCYLVTLDGGLAGESYAVYKPRSGEYPLYDFPHGSLYRREVGSYLVNELLGWNLIPPTVVTRGRHGIGSLQLFIEALDEPVEVDDLRRLALLDVVLNNADRKVDHCLVGAGGKLWGIDHGLTFHAQPKLRTAIWHFAGTVIPELDRADVQHLSTSLAQGNGRAAELRQLIAPAEWRSLQERVNRVADSGKFPDPRYKPVPYRW